MKWRSSILRRGYQGAVSPAAAAAAAGALATRLLSSNTSSNWHLWTSWSVTGHPLYISARQEVIMLAGRTLFRGLPWRSVIVNSNIIIIISSSSSSSSSEELRNALSSFNGDRHDVVYASDWTATAIRHFDCRRSSNVIPSLTPPTPWRWAR